MSSQVLLIVGFNLFVILMLALDLGVFHKRTHTIRVREALIWTGIWVGLALLFNFGIYLWKGPEPALQFLAGYVIEQSLSVDNLFVFLLVFSYFGVPSQLQHKVLFWGIIGAAVMRATLIVVGAALIHRFHWIIYLFGGFLVLTGIRMAFSNDEAVDLANNRVVRLFKRFFPMTPDYQGDRFFVQVDGRRLATPLLLVLVVVETTDLVFAVDSIPAIFAVTTDPMIVYTSNIFAIMGLRSLYFALAGMMELFHFLKIGLSVVLTFVGLKMLLSEIYEIPIGIALAVVAGVLVFSVVASKIWPQPQGHPKASVGALGPDNPLE